MIYGGIDLHKEGVLEKLGMVVRVAVARKMLKIMFYMLKNKRPFKEDPNLERSPVSAMGS